MTPAADASVFSIDGSPPWLAPLARWRDELAAGDVHVALSRAARARGLVTGHGKPLCFVDAADAGATPYEEHIARTGRVPMRNNLHDLFNAAVWLTFPRMKAALNARQAQPSETSTPPSNGRGPVRDAATLFDESGLVLAVAGSAADADVVRRLIANHDWRTLFIEHRARWHRQWMPWLFGHAVMEKLARPFAAVVVRVWIVALEASRVGDLTAADGAVATQIASAVDLAPSRIPPLPVLGIPGWWPANEQAEFYDNAAMFRPLRSDARVI